MNSRTPIRLTPHRGPLATPSTSPESSPTSSTPPSDISHCSTTIEQALDVAILQYRISMLSRPTRHQSLSRFYRQKREATKQGPFGRTTHPCQLSTTFDNVTCSACDLARLLTGIVTFCFLIWGLLELSSYASEQHRQQNIPLSTSRFPLPSPTRALRCHVNPSLCEPRDREQHVAVLQFLSEQIQHAKALSSLSIGLGLPFQAFLETHQAAIPRVPVRHNLTELPHLMQDDTSANLTEFLDSSVLDFTPGGFIGRSLTLALDELGDLVSETIISRGPSTREGPQDAHLHAIYWRTASNLLLEYSAARPRARKLLQQLHALHQQLSPLGFGHGTALSIGGRLSIWLQKNSLGHPASLTEDGMPAFVTGLETTLHNVHRLVAYLDWITEHLSRTTLRDVLKTRHKTDFASCTMSLRELFAQSKPLTPKKRCFCLNDHRVGRPERVEIVVPGSPTVRAGR